MSGVRARAFTKTRACPSSVDISSRGIPPDKSDQIARHIDGCEFCAAEESFLSAHNLTVEDYELAEMPAHLRRLAEALLGGTPNGTKGSRYLRRRGFAFDWDLRFGDVVG